MPATICFWTSPRSIWSSISLSAFGCGRASSTLATRSSILAKSSYPISSAIDRDPLSFAHPEVLQPKSARDVGHGSRPGASTVKRPSLDWRSDLDLGRPEQVLRGRTSSPGSRCVRWTAPGAMTASSQTLSTRRSGRAACGCSGRVTRVKNSRTPARRYSSRLSRRSPRCILAPSLTTSTTMCGTHRSHGRCRPASAAGVRSRRPGRGVGPTASPGVCKATFGAARPDT